MDLRTLFFAQTCTLAAFAVLLWAARSELDRQNGLRTWMLAITLQALAYLVLSNTDLLPPMPRAIVGNGAGAASVALFFVAIRKFTGRRHDARLLVAMAIIVTLVGACTGPHIVAAAIFNGFVYGAVELLNAQALWGTSWADQAAPGSEQRPARLPPDSARVRRVVALCYLAMGILLPVRALALLALGAGSATTMPVGWQGPIYVFGFFYLIITNLGFVLMCKTRAEAAVRVQARTDALTGLANRRALDEEMAQAIAAAQRHRRPFAVVMADVDRFKAFNDSFGHTVGDALLSAFAKRLRGALRTPDRAFRYGGEEFCLLLPDTDLPGARTLAERIRAQVALPPQGVMQALTASFGVAVWQVGDVAEALFGRADEALYRAKNAGRDRVEVG